MARPQLQHALQHMHAGRLAHAEQTCRAILHANPNNFQAQKLLGQITRLVGNHDESIRLFQQLRRARPADLQLLGELGASLTAANQQAAALPLLQRAVQAMPAIAEWKVWLGRCLLSLSRPAQALRVLEEARADAPDNDEALFHLARVLEAAEQPARAESHIRDYLARHPDSIPGRVTLATILEHQNRTAEAADLCRAILQDDPHCDPALGILALCLRAQGNYDEALATLEPLIAATPTPGRALALAPIYLATKRYDECCTLLEDALAQPDLPNPARASMLFALAQAHQGRHDPDAAFEACACANALSPNTFCKDRLARRYDQLRNTLLPNTDLPRADLDASRCIFIVGMPRSGTSLVEQILAAIPAVHSCGELPELPRIINDIDNPADLSQDQLTTLGSHYLDHLDSLAPEARHITDKLPHNFEHLGLIRRMLPGARIIHCTRHPLDTCLSCYFTPLSAWHAYATDLTNLACAYSHYTALMRYWQDTCRIPMLEIRYEQLVADTETHARRLLEFVGLPWDEACLQFHTARRTVTTASVDQVRQPIYTSSVERWRQYEHHLAPLIDALRAAGVELPGID